MSDQINKNKNKFPPLHGGDNRPVTWCYGLASIVGQEQHITNSVTIFSRPSMAIDETGEHGLEEFAVVTLTRAEVAQILKTLEDDIAEMRQGCPDQEFI